MSDVTVVTATIGRLELLECIASVQAQTYACEHVIVVDDGSDAGPWGRIQWTFWRGVQMARTEWVYLLADDDWLEPDAIARLVQAGGDFRYSLVEMLYPDGHRGVIGQANPGWGNVTQQFARRKDFELVPDPDPDHPGADWFLIQRWLKRSMSYGFVDAVLHHHRVNH